VCLQIWNGVVHRGAVWPRQVIDDAQLLGP
jgi:hypothetical protein